MFRYPTRNDSVGGRGLGGILVVCCMCSELFWDGARFGFSLTLGRSATRSFLDIQHKTVFLQRLGEGEFGCEVVDVLVFVIFCRFGL